MKINIDARQRKMRERERERAFVIADALQGTLVVILEMAACGGDTYLI